MRNTNDEATGAAMVRELIDRRIAAVQAKDIDGVMASYAPDVLMFDVVAPLRYTRSDTIRQRAQEWFALYRGPIGYEVRDLSISARDDVAFCHYCYRVSGTRTDGKKVDMWVRATVCLRRIDGRWMITHEHDSVPIDPDSGEAVLDLKP